MEEYADILKKELGEKLLCNVPLGKFVSLKVGGVADFFFTAHNIKELTDAVSAAYKLKIPYIVLGGGYNVVPSDSGFPGLVILNLCSNIVFSPDFSTVIVDSGMNLGKLINLAAGRDLGGLEFLFGVPGTVGGAIYGNAGAFSHSIGDFIKSVTLLIPRGDQIVIVKEDPKWMNFSYRSSKLKTDYADHQYKPVILTATIQLVQRRKDEILRIMQESISKKKGSQPLDEISAGSFFKNAGETKEKAAGYLLETAGAKKLHSGGASFSKKHANFLINRKNATATDIRALAEKAKDQVRAKHNVELEEEIEYIGKW